MNVQQLIQDTWLLLFTQEFITDHLIWFDRLTYIFTIFWCLLAIYLFIYVAFVFFRVIIGFMTIKGV